MKTEDRNHIFHAPLSIIKATHRKRKLHNNHHSSIMGVNLLRQYSLLPKLKFVNLYFFRILLKRFYLNAKSLIFLSVKYLFNKYRKIFSLPVQL